ncbi:SMP-30/gluconolactonase/LRE family protein [Sediminibacterium sp. TEGAF015]|uniref:hypothetical protein n=1 Tax=Sediminibacterium sp. TEGAF015 TaxID=575378 RepID=UPI00220E30BE|nr:hypothetical protein [Sediminibacterium sp. TEGAF015]BDQ10836.1 hypothetical protein TEGAF0_00530 [Sediminibacterium sp. TEGAF015]
MLTRIRYIFIFSCIYLWSVCLYAQHEIKPCQQEPGFIKTLGFDPLWTGLSTSEKKTIGISLIAFEKKAGESAPSPQSIKASVYQHPSWKEAGYLSTITFDRQGNVYAIPAPLISMLYNKPEKLNTVYQIDAKTGEMGEWISLPFYGRPGVNNPYGLLGIAYDCLQQTMAVASVAGSDRYNERGVIYLIDVQSKKIVDTIRNIDAMGLAFALDEKGNKRLYFGKTRSGELHSVQVANNGKWIRKTKRKELTLEGYGPRGDDKARKIKFNGNQMVVSGTAFNYNLQASSEKPETVYTFIWLPKEQKWGLNQYQ